MTATTPGPAPARTVSLWRQRCAEVVVVREAVQAWAANEPDVVAVGLAGSSSRSAMRMGPKPGFGLGWMATLKPRRSSQGWMAASR